MEKVVIREVGGECMCSRHSVQNSQKKSIKLLFSKDTERGANQLKLFSQYQTMLYFQRGFVVRPKCPRTSKNTDAFPQTEKRSGTNSRYGVSLDQNTFKLPASKAWNLLTPPTLETYYYRGEI